MARRRNSGLAAELLDLVSKLPWWVGLLLAAGFFFVLHPIAERPIPQATQPGPMGAMATQMIWRVFAFYGQYLLPLLCAIGALMAVIQRRHRARLLERTTANPAADALNSMSWQQFEQLVGEGFRRQGYQVKETGQAGPDGGVDLELRRDGEGSRIAVVFNGSPLFTGDAGGGESNIRRWIIENDMLEAGIQGSMGIGPVARALPRRGPHSGNEVGANGSEVVIEVHDTADELLLTSARLLK